MKNMVIILCALLWVICAACGGKTSGDLPYDYNAMFQIERIYCDTEDTLLLRYLVGGNVTLLEYNKELGMFEYFCKDASCGHNTNDCIAGNVVGDLENNHGEISLLRNNTNDISNRDTQRYAYISHFNNGRFELGRDPIGSFIHAGGHLYVATVDGGYGYFPSGGGDFILLQEESHFIHKAEIGEYIYGTEYADITDDDSGSRRGYTISRLKTGDPEAEFEVIKEFPIGNLGGVFRSDGEYLYYEDEEFRLMRCNLDGGNETRMTDIRVYIQSVVYDGDYLYFSWYNRQDAFDPDNGKYYRMKRDGSSPPELLAHFDNALDTIIPMADCDYFIVGMAHTQDWLYIIDKDGSNLREIPWE